MKKLLLALSLLLSPYVYSGQHDELSHAMETLNGQLEVLHFLAEAKQADDDHGHHSAKEYNDLIKDSHHIQEAVVKTMQSFRQARPSQKLRVLVQGFNHIENDVHELVEELEHFNDRDFSALGTLIESIKQYAKKITGVGDGHDQHPPSCTISRTFGFKPKFTLNCNHFPPRGKYTVHYEDSHGHHVDVSGSADQNGNVSRYLGEIPGGLFQIYVVDVKDAHGHKIQSLNVSPSF